jgi:hypothetical protein
METMRTSIDTQCLLKKKINDKSASRTSRKNRTTTDIARTKNASIPGSIGKYVPITHRQIPLGQVWNLSKYDWDRYIPRPAVNNCDSGYCTNSELSEASGLGHHEYRQTLLSVCIERKYSNTSNKKASARKRTTKKTAGSTGSQTTPRHRFDLIAWMMSTRPVSRWSEEFPTTLIS